MWSYCEECVYKQDVVCFNVETQCAWIHENYLRCLIGSIFCKLLMSISTRASIACHIEVCGVLEICEHHAKSVNISATSSISSLPDTQSKAGGHGNRLTAMF